MDKNEKYLRFDFFKAAADKCGFSITTIRTAFNYKPITFRTAKKIASTFGVPIACFNIKEDNRGRRKNSTV